MNSLKLAKTRGDARGGAVTALSATLGFMLVPKCPLCVAAYLMTFGVGAGAAFSAAPVVRWLALGLVFVASAALGVATRRRAAEAPQAAEAPCCGGHFGKT